MAETNFNEEDLKRIDRAIAQGVLSVTFEDGRAIQFSTFEELVNRRNFIAQALGAEAGRQRLVSKFKRGVIG